MTKQTGIKISPQSIFSTNELQIMNSSNGPIYVSGSSSSLQTTLNKACLNFMYSDFNVEKLTDYELSSISQVLTAFKAMGVDIKVNGEEPFLSVQEEISTRSIE